MIRQRVIIDLNERVEGRFVPVRASALPAHAAVGTEVLAYEPEDQVVADASIVRFEGPFALLLVEWGSLRDAVPAAEAAPLKNMAGRSWTMPAFGGQHAVTNRPAHA